MPSKMHGVVTLTDPMAYHGNLTLGANADWLGEWDLIKIAGGAESDHHEYGKDWNNIYHIQVTVKRDSTNAAWNLVFCLMVVMTLTLSAFGIDASNLADRNSIVVTSASSCHVCRNY